MSTVKGVYVLVISVGKDIRVNIGALGGVNFEKGCYAYVGSAQNSLEKRLERHLRKVKRKFWHIDYLLDNDAVQVLKVFYKKARKHEECKITKRISKRGILIKGFGSSDCKCQSHLVRIKDCRLLEYLMRKRNWRSDGAPKTLNPLSLKRPKK